MTTVVMHTTRILASVVRGSLGGATTGPGSSVPRPVHGPAHPTRVHSRSPLKESLA